MGTAPTREFRPLTTRGRGTSFPPLFASSDFSLTASFASSAGSLMRLDGSTNTSSPHWKLSARSKLPSITRRSVPTSPSKLRRPLRLLPRSHRTRPSSTNSESTESNCEDGSFDDIADDDDVDDDDDEDDCALSESLFTSDN